MLDIFYFFTVFSSFAHLFYTLYIQYCKKLPRAFSVLAAQLR